MREKKHGSAMISVRGVRTAWRSLAKHWCIAWVRSAVAFSAQMNCMSGPGARAICQLPGVTTARYDVQMFGGTMYGRSVASYLLSFTTQGALAFIPLLPAVKGIRAAVKLRQDDKWVLADAQAQSLAAAIIPGDPSLNADESMRRSMMARARLRPSDHPIACKAVADPFGLRSRADAVRLQFVCRSTQALGKTSV